MLNPAHPYTCGNPGSKSPMTSIASSSWEFNPPHAYFQWVLPSDTICAQNSGNIHYTVFTKKAKMDFLQTPAIRDNSNNFQI
jgi:hypothetical protein